jgi:hypothetical protein
MKKMYGLLTAALMSSVLSVAQDPLTSANFNSYTPTLTGAGASGTWNINISGSARQWGDQTYLNADGAVNSYMLSFGADGHWHPTSSPFVRNWLGLPANGETFQTITDRGSSTTNNIRGGSYIDVADYQNGAFRVYNGINFTGGIGAGGWTGSLTTADFGVYATGRLGLFTNSTLKMLIDNNGNVGIGTIAPANKISFPDVNVSTDHDGITWFSPGGDPTSYGIHRTAGTWLGPDYQQLRLGWQTGVVIDPGTAHGKSYLDVQGNGVRVTQGSIGIGVIDTKGYKLAVDGQAIFKKVVVRTSSPWPDYIFDSSYQLAPLCQVEQYVRENKHLPDLPSAAVVEKDGIDVGGNQALLLKKIEELTLYIIEQNKQLLAQGERIKKLEEKKN